MNTPPGSGSLLDKAWNKKMSMVKAPKGRAKPSVEQKVAKCIADTVAKECSYEEIYCIVKNGQTMEERLREDKQRHLEDPTFSMGGNYYKTLFNLYKGLDRLELLVVPDESLPVDKKWEEATIACYRNPVNRSKMRSLLKNATSMNRREICGVMTWLLDLRPSASDEQRACCKEVLQCAVRLDWAAKVPDAMHGFKPKFDEILNQ
eukprot:6457510-Amphidinium_carterae.1